MPEVRLSVRIAACRSSFYQRFNVGGFHAFMPLLSPFTLLLLATGLGFLLVAIGVVPLIHKNVHGSISATVLSMGLALIVLQLLVVGTINPNVLYGLSGSVLIILGLPLAIFVVSLSFLFHRNRLSLPNAVVCGFIGIIGLWYLGGFVLMQTACGINPSGGSW